MPPAPPLTTDHLASVLTLAAANLDGERAFPYLIRLRDEGDEVELGWLPLEPGSHPLDALVRFRAPDDWAAIGVAATGRLRHLDDPGAPPVPVRTAHLVSRTGLWASWWDGDAEPVLLSGTPADPSRPVGRMDDACRRALGLPTAPPATDTGALWAAQWLDRIAAEASTAAGRRRLARWPAVACLHPAAAALLPGAADDPPTPATLAARARQLAEWRDWPSLRLRCAAGAWHAPDVSAGTAAWLDDGAFSRWVLGAYPELADLLDTARSLLDGDVADAVRQVLHESIGADP